MHRSKFILGAIALIAAMPTLAQQLPNRKDRPPDFSCTGGQPLDFTREELEQKALDEIERRGRKPPPRYSTQLMRWGCDWWVFVIHHPEETGTDFGVQVDGISGAVKQYVGR